MASILVISGKSSGYYLALDDNPSTVVVIGRDEGCDVQVLDELVSRRHLEIKFDSESKAYLATDVESANGVVINGRQITQPVPLADNDAIVIGESKLFFTTKNYPDREAAVLDIKQRGERGKNTMIQ